MKPVKRTRQTPTPTTIPAKEVLSISLGVSAKIRDRWFKASLITRGGVPKLHVFSLKAFKDHREAFPSTEKKPGTYYELYVLEMGIRLVHEEDIEFSKEALKAIENSRVKEVANLTVQQKGAPKAPLIEVIVTGPQVVRKVRVRTIAPVPVAVPKTVEQPKPPQVEPPKEPEAPPLTQRPAKVAPRNIQDRFRKP